MATFYHKGLSGVEKNLNLAIKWYEDAATSGCVQAMNSLGSLFYNDFKDYVQAAEWYKKAANKGCTRALNNLGICFELG